MDTLLAAFFAFGRNCLGLVTRPYETCRRIVDSAKPAELVFVGLLLWIYFGLASLVKVASFRPFLLTRQFVVLAVATLATYAMVVTLLWIMSRVLKTATSLRGIVMIWGYSLVPTVLWFLATSLLYVLIPPPRTVRPLGILFSVVFLVFSLTMFFWKATIAYLTLRFGLKLNLGKIILVVLILAPIIGAYSIWMYKLGIFRIPFI